MVMLRLTQGYGQRGCEVQTQGAGRACPTSDRPDFRLSITAQSGPGETKPNAMADVGDAGLALLAHGHCQAEPALFFQIKTVSDHAQTPFQSIILC